jgi:hypothetical protein
MDWLSTTLATLKFVGIIVSGIGAIAAAIPKSNAPPPESRMGRLWRELTAKQVGLNIAVIGLLVTFLSQFVETLKTNSDVKADREKYAAEMTALKEQGRTANLSLDSLQDLMTRFDNFGYAVDFKLPTSDPRVAALISELHQLASHGLSAGVPNPANLQLIGIGTPNATIILSPLSWDQPVLSQVLPTLRKLSGVWQAMPLRAGNVWINRSAQSIDDLTKRLSEGTDLFMFNMAFADNNQGGLFYYDTDRSLHIRTSDFLSRSIDNSCWFSDAHIIGTHHLAGAQFVTEMNWSGPSARQQPPDVLTRQIRPDYIRLTVGGSSLFLYDLTTRLSTPVYGQNPNPGFYSEFTFPKEADILAGKGDRPLFVLFDYHLDVANVPDTCRQ